jgi:hypothetical protein
MPDTLGFDPSTRRETWLFQKMGIDQVTGKPMYRRLGYNYVSYDGSPDKYLEPVVSELENYPGMNPNVSGEPGIVVGFEFFDSRPFEGIGLNDVTIE